MVCRYDRVRNISTGRFGTTVLVKSDGRLSVMKTIDVSRLGSARLRETVVQELTALARLRHPHLVAVTDCFREGGVVCIVAEYAEAGNIAGRIERARVARTPFEEHTMLQWLTQTALAFKYVHESGALHRDLRARRLLLTSRGSILVSGLAVSASLAQALRPEAPEIEAVRYQAPELLAGSAAHTCSSDIWALGIVLFELVTLRPPFDHSHPRNLVERILSGPLPPLPTNAPADLRSLCASLMRRDAAARPSAAEVLREPFVQASLRALLHAHPMPSPGLWGSTQVQVHRAGPPPSPRTQLVPPGALKPYRVGPLMLASPAQTPRALRKVGEMCSRNMARELVGPSATLPKQRLAEAAAGGAEPPCPAEFAGDDPKRPSTTAAFAGEVVQELLAEVLAGDGRGGPVSPQAACVEEQFNMLELTGPLDIGAGHPA